MSFCLQIIKNAEQPAQKIKTGTVKKCLINNAMPHINEYLTFSMTFSDNVSFVSNAL
jgi:hypothetical protein